MTYNEELNKTDEQIITAYLDYVNNFLTVSKFAEYHNLTESDAYYIINLGRKLNNELSKN